MMHGSVQPPSPCSSPAVQVSWSGVLLLVFTVRKKEWHRQRAKVHPWLFPHPSILHILTWAAATLTRGGKRRGRFNWSGTSGDQSVYESEIRSSEWVQPLLSPTPTLMSPFHPSILAQIRAAGPANRGGPPWLSTVRGWCNSGTDAGRLREQKEEGWLGQSRHGPWSLEDGPGRTVK